MLTVSLPFFRRVLADLFFGALGVLVVLFVWTLADDLLWLHRVHALNRQQTAAAPAPSSAPGAPAPPAGGSR